MKLSLKVLSTILTALAPLASASCSLEGGNYFCDSVGAVTYENVGYSGSYMDVTFMDESTCECTQQSVSFSGTNAPLDQELSVHFRGPVKLLQFGVYYPNTASSAKKVKRDADFDLCTETKHVHHAHKRDAALEIVEHTETIYVDAQGNIVTQDAETPGSLTQTTTILSSSPELAVVSSSSPTKATTSSSSAQSKSSSASKTSSAAKTTATSSSSGDWVRSSYFTPGSASNLVFLNTKGGSASGTFSTCFGMSLSYCSADGLEAVSEAVALDEVTVPSDTEYVIFSGESCDNGEDGCGYYRENIPAYHGFGGTEKIFVFEFTMPHDTSSAADSASNPDMPAIWLLNAKIPRTLQYGKAECSCWTTGCGELDLFEVLLKGDERLITHIHSGQGSDGTQTGGGGTQDYFARPSDSTMKAAVIFTDSGIQLVVVDDDTDFSSSLSDETVNSWLSATGGVATLST